MLLNGDRSVVAAGSARHMSTMRNTVVAVPQHKSQPGNAMSHDNINAIL